MPKRRYGHDPLQEAFDATPEQLGRAAVYSAEHLRELSDNIADWHPSNPPDRPRIVDRALCDRRVRDKPYTNVELPDVIEAKGKAG